MIGPRAFLWHLRQLWGDLRGAAAAEAAAVLPLLALLSLGAFQVSAMTARYDELQTAASEATAIALAKRPTSVSDLATIKAILMTSTRLTSDKVTVYYQFRCGTSLNTTLDQTSCATGVRAWRSLRIILVAPYTPFWNRMGIGSTVNVRLDRSVQLG